MTHTIATRIALAGAVLCGLLFLALLPSNPAAAQVRADRGCDISGQQDDLGTSYVTSVKAKNVACGRALKVIKAYHKCRHENGGDNGKCKGKVKGFKCKEGKREGVPDVQYNAKVTCSAGAKKITHSYTQNLG